MVFVYKVEIEDEHHKPDMKLSLVNNKDKAKEAREMNSIPNYAS